MDGGIGERFEKLIERQVMESYGFDPSKIRQNIDPTKFLKFDETFIKLNALDKHSNLISEIEQFGGKVVEANDKLISFLFSRTGMAKYAEAYLNRKGGLKIVRDMEYLEIIESVPLIEKRWRKVTHA
jgi:hypothetical protein